MFHLNSRAFCQGISMLTRAETIGKVLSHPNRGTFTPDSKMPDMTSLYKDLELFSAACTTIGANVTKSATDGFLKTNKGKELVIKDYAQGMSFLQQTLNHELNSVALFALAPGKADYWEPKEPLFGIPAHERFPAAIDDIAAAGKCFATEQATACVFHLMRAMEVALKELAKELGITYAPSWESYIRQLTKLMETEHAKRTRKVKKNLSFYREILGDLNAVKFAWRNTTMHAIKKYDMSEAEDVYRAVRTFMQRLAAGLSPLKAKGGVA